MPGPYERGKLKKLQFILAALALLIPYTTRAQAQESQSRSLKVHLDPAQTEIHWSVRAGFRTLHGALQLKNGEFVVNPATGLAEGEILVDATQAKAGDNADQMRDAVLDSKRYPGMIFHPNNFKGGFPEGDGSHETTAVGTFNIHGEDHPLEMPLKLQLSSGAVTATTHFTVPYTSWGMKYPGSLFHPVGKQIEVQVTARGSVQKAE
jgi:hypothetical protein